MKFKYERKINYYETDKMGVVHHSNYIRFLEEARCEFMNEVGLSYSKLEEMGIMIPVLSVNCTYKRHVTFDDTIVINFAIVEFTGVRMTVEYTITNKETDEVIMTAETKHCFTDSNLKPISLKRPYPEIYEKYEKIIEK